MNKPLVGILMGSDSDMPVMKDAAEFLEGCGVECEVTIVSAHRTPKRLVKAPPGRCAVRCTVVVTLEKRTESTRSMTGLGF